MKNRSFLGGNYQILIKRLFSSYQYIVMKKAITRNIIQQIIYNRVLKVISPLILVTSEFSSYLIHLMDQFVMKTCQKKFTNYIENLNRIEILQPFGLGFIANDYHHLPGCTFFHTSFKLEHRHLDVINKPNLQIQHDQRFRNMPKMVKENFVEQNFSVNRTMPLKVEEPESVDEDEPEELTPSARRNLNLENLEAIKGKSIVKVDDIKQKGNSEQEFIQLSLEKSKGASSKEVSRNLSENVSKVTMVGKKKGSMTSSMQNHYLDNFEPSNEATQNSRDAEQSESRHPQQDLIQYMKEQYRRNQIQSNLKRVKLGKFVNYVTERKYV